MGATSRYGLRWPANTDPATIWTYLKNLADDVEGRLASMDDRLALTAYNPAFRGGTTGTTGSQSGGWSKNGRRVYVRADLLLATGQSLSGGVWTINLPTAAAAGAQTLYGHYVSGDVPHMIAARVVGTTAVLLDGSDYLTAPLSGTVSGANEVRLSGVYESAA